LRTLGLAAAVCQTFARPIRTLGVGAGGASAPAG